MTACDAAPHNFSEACIWSPASNSLSACTRQALCLFYVLFSGHRNLVRRIILANYGLGYHLVSEDSFNMDNHVRVRLAPSPTGSPHVGMMRTAIYNWLFARGRGGTFIVRIEDTDQGRLVEGSVDEMLESLRWLGIEWDEGPDIGGPNAPYHQSARLDDYRRIADLLVERGAAYRGNGSPEKLEAARKDRGGYGGKRRDSGETGGSGSSVVRFAMPTEGTTVLDDLIRGRVTFENELVDDFVLLKSDGFPTYHLASVVDDRSMGISHVFRGEEWLPSVPRHLQLYKALGWEPPLFVHLPQILAPDRSKLSKRHGAVSVSGVPRDGLPAQGDGQLPRPAGLVPRR